MIEIGKVINIKAALAEVELPANTKCKDCKACLFVSPSKRIILVSNKIKARKNDKVEVFIYESKAFAALILFIIPLSVFLTSFVLCYQLVRINELYSVVIAFTVTFIVYFVIKVLSSNLEYKSHIRKIIRP